MQRATLAILALLLVLGGLTTYQLYSLGPLVREEPLNVRLIDMQEIVSEWTSGSVSHRVKTVRETGESEEAWIARHDAALSQALQQYPPD